MERQIVIATPRAPALADQATSDDQLVALWLHGRSAATAKAYRADATHFRTATALPLGAITLGDLQTYANGLTTLAPATQARRLAAVKSLISFGHRLGYLPFDVGRVLRLPKVRNRLAERIISERQTLRLIGDRDEAEKLTARRNRVLLLLGYAAGLRVSELCGLRWRDAQDRSDGDGQINIFGKGGKTRVVRLPASVWKELLELRAGAADEAPIFRSREGGHLDQSQVNRIVHAAAKRANLPAGVSPHWLRHAHASHAIERNAPIHLVQATLGHASVATTGRYLHARPSESSSRYLPL
jgi:integrase/recombinase XerD